MGEYAVVQITVAMLYLGSFGGSHLLDVSNSVQLFLLLP